MFMLKRTPWKYLKTFFSIIYEWQNKFLFYAHFIQHNNKDEKNKKGSKESSLENCVLTLIPCENNFLSVLSSKFSGKIYIKGLYYTKSYEQKRITTRNMIYIIYCIYITKIFILKRIHKIYKTNSREICVPWKSQQQQKIFLLVFSCPIKHQTFLHSRTWIIRDEDEGREGLSNVVGV